jgi:hypothetical protein
LKSLGTVVAAASRLLTGGRPRKTRKRARMPDEVGVGPSEADAISVAVRSEGGGYS